MCLLGSRLKELRKEMKLSQNELADLLGVTKMTVSRYENSTREPDNNMLLKISEVLNVSVSYLLGESNIPVSNNEQLFLKELDNLITIVSKNDVNKDEILNSLKFIKDTMMQIEKSRS